jgi:phage terminase small subunit
MAESIEDLIPPEPKQPDTKPISAKGQKFVDEYMVDLNASRAAKAAGYKAPQIPSEHAVILEIERRRKADARKLHITQKRNLLELARVGYFDPRRLFKPDGTIKEVHELDDDVAAVIAGFDYEEQGADKNFKRVFKYKFIPKLPALESLSKYLGMYPAEKHEHTGKDGGAIEVESMSDNDRARRIMFVLNSAIQNKKETEDVNYEEQETLPIVTQEK